MPDQPQPPARRSLRERMADPSTGVSNPLTETTMTSIGGLDMLSTAFRVGDSGEIIVDTQVAPIAAPLTRIDEAKVIDTSWALSHHLLLFGPDVEPDELEALAVSVWDESGWSGPGMLRLGGQAALQGPWHVDEGLRALLGSAEDLTQVWVVIATPSRGSAPSADMIASNEWACAFPLGMPVGVEFKVLLTLRRMVRRLAGALRVEGSGFLMRPDPESAVNLAVYSSRWVDPPTMLAALRPEFPTALDSREVPTAAPIQLSAQDVERISTIANSTPAMPPEIAQQIARARAAAAAAAAAPSAVEGYALMAPAGNRSEFMLEVHRVPRPPQVLRWESWTTEGVYEYRLRWIGPEGASDIAPGSLSRAARMERSRASGDIERAAGLVVDVVGGAVIDEDGFLVALNRS